MGTEYGLMEAGMIKEKMPPSNNFTSSVLNVWLMCVCCSCKLRQIFTHKLNTLHFAFWGDWNSTQSWRRSCQFFAWCFLSVRFLSQLVFMVFMVGIMISSRHCFRYKTFKVQCMSSIPCRLRCCEKAFWRKRENLNIFSSDLTLWILTTHICVKNNVLASMICFLFNLSYNDMIMCEWHQLMYIAIITPRKPTTPPHFRCIPTVRLATKPKMPNEKHQKLRLFIVKF